MKLNFDSIKAHAAEISIGAGIATGVYAIVSGITATPKALKLMEAKKKELGVEQLTKKDVIKTTWKCYIPTAVSTVASGAFIIGGTVSLGRKAGAMAAAYSFVDSAFRDYKDAVKETVDEAKAKEIQTAADQKRVERMPESTPQIIVMTDDKQLFVDPFDNEFVSTVADIKVACSIINRRIHDDSWCPYVDFRELVGLETYGYYSSSLYNEMGWFDEFDFNDMYMSPVKTKSGKSALALNFDLKSKNDKDYYHKLYYR